MRIYLQLLIVVLFASFTAAHAGTITVTFTSANAGALSCFQNAPLSASCSDSRSNGSASAVANISTGHLGAAVSATGPLGGGGIAYATIAMSLQDFTDSDVMEIDMSLAGSFYNGGANATATVDDGNSVMSFGVSCGDGIVFLYNRNCNPAGGINKVFIPLVNVDTLSLEFLLQPGITNVPGYADFLNSFDSTIRVPNRTVIVNGPVGTFFQPQSSSVPEPASVLLLSVGLIPLLLRRRTLMRIRSLVLALAAVSMVASAHAGTITVTSTSAFAATMVCNHVSTFTASCSDSTSSGSASAVADVGSGHVGASVGASAPGFVTAIGQIVVNLDLKDFTDQDLLIIDMSLAGSFNNGGAIASLFVDDGNSVTTYAIACGDGEVRLYNVPCKPDGGTQQVALNLSLYDSLSLTFQLQPGISNVPGFAAFLNSFDSTIHVPNGTTIVNGPGGTFFQVHSASVPEPASLLLIGAGLMAFLPWRRRSRRVI